jgi:PAS domain S-box-containing protein
LIIHDLETGLVIEANPAACTMYGYAHHEFIGLHPAILIHPDNDHQFTEYVQAVQSQGVYIAQQVHMRRDGSQFYVELSGTVYTDQAAPIS